MSPILVSTEEFLNIWQSEYNLEFSRIACYQLTTHLPRLVVFERRTTASDKQTNALTLSKFIYRYNVAFLHIMLETKFNK